MLKIKAPRPFQKKRDRKSVKKLEPEAPARQPKEQATTFPRSIQVFLLSNLMPCEATQSCLKTPALTEAQLNQVNVYSKNPQAHLQWLKQLKLTQLPKSREILSAEILATRKDEEGKQFFYLQFDKQKQINALWLEESEEIMPFQEFISSAYPISPTYVKDSAGPLDEEPSVERSNLSLFSNLKHIENIAESWKHQDEYSTIYVVSDVVGGFEKMKKKPTERLPSPAQINNNVLQYDSSSCDGSSQFQVERAGPVIGGRQTTALGFCEVSGTQQSIPVSNVAAFGLVPIDEPEFNPLQSQNPESYSNTAVRDFDHQINVDETMEESPPLEESSAQDHDGSYTPPGSDQGSVFSISNDLNQNQASSCDWQSEMSDDEMEGGESENIFITKRVVHRPAKKIHLVETPPSTPVPVPVIHLTDTFNDVTSLQASIDHSDYEEPLLCEEDLKVESSISNEKPQSMEAEGSATKQPIGEFELYIDQGDPTLNTGQEEQFNRLGLQDEAVISDSAPQELVTTINKQEDEQEESSSEANSYMSDSELQLPETNLACKYRASQIKEDFLDGKKELSFTTQSDLIDQQLFQAFNKRKARIKNVGIIQFSDVTLLPLYYSPVYLGKKMSPRGMALKDFAPCLHFCEYCLSYYPDRTEFLKHKAEERLSCNKLLQPPGVQIYPRNELADSEPPVKLFMIPGKAHKLFCQNLCLLSKFFLGSKTLFFEVDSFYFYVLVERNGRGGYEVAGYFSQERNLSDSFNLACIMVLPHHQRKGYGRLLISLSYILSKNVFQKRSTPERPLSRTGGLSYLSYWSSHILEAIVKLRTERPEGEVCIMDIEEETGIQAEDIVLTFQCLGLLEEDSKGTFRVRGLDLRKLSRKLRTSGAKYSASEFNLERVSKIIEEDLASLAKKQKSV